MSATTFIIGVVTLIWFVLVYRILPTARPLSSPQVSKIDWIAYTFLLWQFVGNSLLCPTPTFCFVESREVGTQLVTEGLTFSNYMTVGATIIAGLYLTFLLLSGRWPLSQLFERHYKPLFVLITIYAVSTAWSYYPLFSAFRIFEIMVYSMLSIHLFSNLCKLEDFIRLLAIMIAVWILLEIPWITIRLQEGIIFSSGKSNLLPAICALMLLFIPYSSIRYKPLLFAMGFVGFVLGGSTATLAFLMVSLWVLPLLSSNILLRLVSGIALVSTLGFASLFLFFPQEFPVVIDVVSTLLQKPRSSLLNATGRHNIWAMFWTLSKDVPFGFGFGSERFFQYIANQNLLLKYYWLSNINLNVAHNALLSSWLSAGWIGLFSIVFFIYSGITTALRCNRALRSPALAAIVLLTLNSMTTLGIGTLYGVFWFLWIGVLALIAQSQDKSLDAPVSPLPYPRILPAHQGAR